MSSNEAESGRSGMWERGVGKCPTRLDGARLVPFTADPPTPVQPPFSHISFKVDLKFQSGRPRYEGGGGRRGRRGEVGSGGRSVL